MTSANFSGADLDQLRALSARLKAQSGKMREIANSSTFALQAAEWTGGEIDAIRDQWRRNSVPTIMRLAEALDELGSDLDQHMLEQERASGGGASGPWSDFIDMIRRSIDKFIGGIVGPGPGGEAGPSGPGPHPREQDTGGDTDEGNSPPQGGSDSSRPEPSQEAFDRRAGGNPAFGPGGQFDGQCTSWVHFRRNQLGLTSPIRWEDGGFVGTGGSQLTQIADPVSGAVGSFPGNTHTFIVEGVSTAEPRTITVSEMNVGPMVNAARSETSGLGTVSTDTYTETAPGSGVWRNSNGVERRLSFAN
ncbi:MAG: CHAP domain-containing protein [Actinobacteria bacterium]|nr:CHAP domain-containing protein [Actinomycetota bacterium]MBU1607923.1 CHAP domain-containing protein [Actinomycetota bacterium]MBU2316099.1 CHAP domain-containing protein [Actinomycetota bacterium]MBU2386047.1 CHAP domain-containing protein [Actinomycetota bacterium]